MNMAENRKIEFEQLKDRYVEEEKVWNTKFSRISTLRVFSFLLGAAGLIIGISENKIAFTLPGAFLLLLFVFLVKLHSDIAVKQEQTRCRREVCERYVERFEAGWRQSAADGRQFEDEDECVEQDVDLLGRNSLYQMLSVCHTQIGKERFAARLHERYVPQEKLSQRRDAISELSGDIGFAVAFETAGCAVEKGKKQFDPLAFEQFCKDESTGKLPAFAHVVRFLLPLYELTTFILFLCGVLHYGYALVGFLVILSFSWLTKSVTDTVILPTYYASAVCNDYEAMLRLVAEKEFKSEILVQMQKYAGGDNGAVKAFDKLRGISQAYNISFNPLIHQLLSGFILWDYQLASLVGRWKKRYGSQLAGCFSMLGDLEELLSFSVLGMVRDTQNADVKFADAKVSFAAEEMYHPLLLLEQAQGNSVQLADGITIITGSNMSGKTTFLRTVAVNLVLAYLGAPVCAKRLSATYMKLFTSMRVKDDVAHGISTFYAEILRIKEMAKYRQEDMPMLCLIDEIFKGTNSADRIVGAREVIVKLAGKNCMTVVSTHDFELCDMKDGHGTPAVNYHFQEYYEGDALRFDYKIRDGRCTTTNARAILRMAGFEIS